MEDTKQQLIFENLWQKKDSPFHASIVQLWKMNAPDLPAEQFTNRLYQIVFAVVNESGEVVGVSTAFKTYLKQLRKYMYAFRCLVDPAYRSPGLPSALIVKTRDFLEDIHASEIEGGEPCIGMITLVENEHFRKVRNEAIWPASKMVYIGNSAKGYPIRVYYFNKALI